MLDIESFFLLSDVLLLKHYRNYILNHCSGYGPFFFFFFDLTIAIYTTHAHTVLRMAETHTLFWGGQRGFEPLPNGRKFSLAPLSQMPSGPVDMVLWEELMVLSVDWLAWLTCVKQTPYPKCIALHLSLLWTWCQQHTLNCHKVYHPSP